MVLIDVKEETRYGMKISEARFEDIRKLQTMFADKICRILWSLVNTVFS